MRDSTDTPDSLEDFRGKRVAIDISVYLHAGLRSSAAAVQFHTTPAVPVTAITSLLCRVVDIAKTFDIQLVAVTDGARHPGKASVDQSRAAAASLNMARISELVAADRPADFNEVQKLRKGACSVRADVLKVAVDYLTSREVEVIGAPFEADWECVHLEKVGYVSAIISSDADLFVLGSVRLVNNLDLNDGTCFIVKREEAMESGNLGSGKLIARGWGIAKYRGIVEPGGPIQEGNGAGRLELRVA